MLTMESLATTIGCGRRHVEGRRVSIAIDGPYIARRKSGSRGEPRDARDRPFAKACTAWHICQVYSLICQIVQNAIGYLFFGF